ncbi:MAG: hypothetical protein HYS65_18140 [Betaproteobacteria bacterium]|nr:hypothetical protein [Betaproteobacteria bacterium]
MTVTVSVHFRVRLAPQRRHRHRRQIGVNDIVGSEVPIPEIAPAHATAGRPEKIAAFAQQKRQRSNFDAMVVPVGPNLATVMKQTAASGPQVKKRKTRLLRQQQCGGPGRRTARKIKRHLGLTGFSVHQRQQHETAKEPERGQGKRERRDQCRGEREVNWQPPDRHAKPVADKRCERSVEQRPLEVAGNPLLRQCRRCGGNQRHRQQSQKLDPQRR